MAIDSIHSLQTHLQWALELEHSTIAPYLCALYSIPEGTNHQAATIVRSVVMEEMLHMTLVANVLNAVGGTPRLAERSVVPKYPMFLPHSDDSFQVQLLPLCPEALEVFLKIESPTPSGAPPRGNRYQTIGQFYEAIELGLGRLVKEHGERAVFKGKRTRQVLPDTWYYGGGGNVIEVHDLETSLAALDEITEQGEGADGGITDGDGRFDDIDELAHFYRFNELLQGRRYDATDTEASGPTGSELPVDWGVIAPMAPNPRSAKYREYPTIHRQMVVFNRIYTRLLRQLETGFTGKPEALRDAAPIMYELRYQAEALMRIPSPLYPGRTVGPSFEWDGSTPT